MQDFVRFQTRKKLTPSHMVVLLLYLPLLSYHNGKHTGTVRKLKHLSRVTQEIVFLWIVSGDGSKIILRMGKVMFSCEK